MGVFINMMIFNNTTDNVGSTKVMQLSSNVSALICKIPFINRIICNIWGKHWEIVVTLIIALFVSLVIMPRLMK